LLRKAKESEKPMSRYHEDDELKEDLEPRELPEVKLSESGPCCVCGTPNCTNACFCCGEPVCMDPTDYQGDSACGGWILDWWHNSAYDPDDGNEFWCRGCMEAEEMTHRACISPTESTTNAEGDVPMDVDYEAWLANF
jgi:hypothetical protein